LIILGRDCLREHWLSIDGQRIFARVSKTMPQHPGPAVVLVHGLGVSSRYMVPLARELALVYPTFAPDLPGFGRSSRPRTVLAIRELARWLGVWLEHMGIQRPVLIGNSMGCQVVAETENVSAAVLLGPTMDPSGGVLGQVGRLVMDQFREPLSLIPLQAFDYLHNGPIRTVRTFRRALAHGMIERVSRLTVPTLVIRGENDPIVSAWFVRQLVLRMPHAELQTIAGAGHALNYNSPREVAGMVDQFICRGFSIA
jgi:pimeloyl-ACP methyl ester carboxylesterase